MARLLNHLVDEAALRAPEAVAVRCGGESLLYQQLARRSNGLARVLLETGLRKRDRVAVLLTRTFQVPISFYGIAAAGGILVPIDPKSPAQQVIRILRATGAQRLITEPRKGAVAREALAACPEVSHIVGLEPQDEEMEGQSELASRHYIPWPTVLEEACDQPPPVDVIDLDPAYILHTSGSTGEPKLIQHTHRSALSFVEWAAAEYSLTAEDRLSNHSSHHTCFATFDYYAAARAGAATVLLTPAVLMMPGSLSTLLEQERVSVWYSVPTALVQLSLRGSLEARDLSALRWVLFAGETFPEKHLRRLQKQLPGARFSHVYGSTEVNVCTYYHLPQPRDLETGDLETGDFETDDLETGDLETSDLGTSDLGTTVTEDPLPGDPLPIGRACSTSGTLVVDEQLRPVPRGETGELLVRGSTLMSGYWGDPERNLTALVRQTQAGDLEEIYFRTGDRVRESEDGQLAFVARTDRQVKVRGFRVELEEVEAALLSLDGVNEGAVVTVPDGEGSLAIQAAVVLSSRRPEGMDAPAGDAGDGGERELLSQLKKALPMQAIPSRIAILDSLPRTPTGKTDRNTLRQRLTT
ncbi:MAG: AMP-binding protein [Deltaproteobacteria bacterium]|nr:AMP-binding protein [Deltaproteobacteria bacterium]